MHNSAHDATYQAAYHHVRLNPRVRSAGVALLAAAGLLLGMLGMSASASASSPASASRPHAKAATTSGRSTEVVSSKRAAAGARPVGGATIAGHVTFPSDDECSFWGYLCFWSDRTVILRQGQYARRGYIDNDGNYSVSGLKAGSYRVTFNRLSGYHETVAQFYKGRDESEGVASATLVTVDTNETKSIETATLERGGSISGVLTDPSGNALDNCTVQAYSADGKLVTRAGYSYNGSFTIRGLTTGSYRVRVVPTRYGDCAGTSQYVVNAGGGALGVESAAVPIAVVQGEPVNIDDNLVYAIKGKISGHVDLPDGASHRDRVVIARNGHYTRTTHVDRDGDYTITGLNKGTYRVTFARVSGMATVGAVFYHDHQEGAGVASILPSERVHLAKGQAVTGIDGTVSTGGSISGALVDPDGVALRNCYVQAFTSDNRLVTRAAFTDRDGHFTVGGLATGSYEVRVVKAPHNRYHRTFNRCNGAPQFYDGDNKLGGDKAGAQPIPVTLGADTPVSGPLTYSYGATISGHVTLPEGANRYVDGKVVVRRGHHTWRARIDNNGDYTVRHLPAGSYRVTFNRLSGFANAAAQFYSGRSESAGVINATAVGLGADEHKVNINGTLARGGHITGTLVDTNGTPLRCLVQAFTTDGSRVTRNGISTVDSGGAFDIGGLTSGAYYLRVVRGHQCKLPIQYLAGSGTLTSVGPGVTKTAAQGNTVTVNTLTYPSSSATPVILNQTAPSITGTPEVGQTLTAHAGTWNPADGVTYSYQWRAGNNDIVGATFSTLTLTSAQANKSVSVDVTAHKSGYLDATKTSDPVGPVVQNVVTNTVPPSVSGTPQVGQTLTADNGTWQPSGVTFAYQWLANGAEIANATGSTYALTSNEKDKSISVRVTGSKPDFTSLVRTSAQVGPVTAAGIPVVTNQAPPNVSGATQVGQMLTANHGDWTPGDVAYAYQWVAGGVDIPGANQSTYVLTSNEATKMVSVRVTASKAGYTSLSKTSATVGPVTTPATPTVTNTAAPAIAGTAQAGQTLTASSGAWAPTDVSFTYQWLANGTPIGGAVGAAYALTGNEVGKTIVVRVTGSKSGFNSGSKDSAAVGPVTAATVVTAPPPAAPAGPLTFTLSQKPSFRGTAKVGQALTAVSGVTTPAATTVTYQWLLNGKAIKNATKSKLKLTKSFVGDKVSLQVTYVASGYTTLVSTSSAKKVKAAPKKPKK